MIFRFGLMLLLLAQAAKTQGIIRLKTRNFTPAAIDVPGRPGRSRLIERRHYLVLFASYPGPAVLAELANRRIRVVGYVPENGLMVSAEILNLRGLGATWFGPMDPADKISPSAALRSTGAYLVIFQPDTDTLADRALVQGAGYTIVENTDLLAGQFVVTGAYSGLTDLAALDQVAYILPASTDLLSGQSVAACAGAITQAGPVAQYVQMGGGWGRDANGAVALQYFVDSVTPKVPESLLRSEMARAFDEWAQYADITIGPAGQPNQARAIDILFARFAHGDAYPFDGPGKQLAHTFYPAPYNGEPVAGDMHLDADESWNVGGPGVDLYSVALHEAGHALGLGHSDNPGSVMYPYYRLQTVLTGDDIAGIQALYGAKRTISPEPPVGTGTSSSGATGGSSGTPGTGSGGVDTVPPNLSIVSPGSTIVSSYSAAITIRGSASDNVGVTAVKWTTSTGSAGDATGTVAWSATIPLLVGDNMVTVRAYDAAGNSAWRTVTVVRR